MAVRTLHVGLLVALGVVLGGAALVAAFRLQEHAGQAAAGNTIGAVTFQPSPKDAPGAREGKLVLVTARRGSHGDAFAALMDALDAYCLDGRGYSLWDMEPGGEVDPGEWSRPSQPAGTRFSQSFSCDAPLPNEIALPSGSSDAGASRLVSQALGGEGEVSVAPVPFNRLVPKYRAFDQSLGARIRGFSARRCEGGPTVVRRIVVGTYPPSTAPETGPVHNQTMMLGTDLACLGPEGGQD